MSPIKSPRLSEKEWDDVADLCEQGASGCDIGYEEHAPMARIRAAQWMRVLAMRAHINARRVEARVRSKQRNNKEQHGTDLQAE